MTKRNRKRIQEWTLILAVLTAVGKLAAFIVSHWPW
jgi:hypothetical protein